MQYYLIWLMCALATPLYIYADELVVETSYGKIRGVTLTAATGKKVDAWYSIPYAKQPLGKLRFRPSVPPQKWDATLETTTLPSACMQNIDTLFGDFPGAKMWVPNTPISEDCLYINVVVPKPRPTNASVMVWIYGGGFSTGSSSLYIYDHKILASEENVIIVSMQYRLNSLGFLYLGTSDAPGNAGMFDQVLALKWIVDNIAMFGGNPNSITLFGESSGSAMVSHHLLSPLSQDLFSRAIMQSGTVTAPWDLMSNAEAIENGLELAKQLNCSHDKENLTVIIDCLQNADATLLMKAASAIPRSCIICPNFRIVIDGKLITDDSLVILRAGNFKKAEILLGANANEGSYFLLYAFPDLFKNKEDITLSRNDFVKCVSQLSPRNAEELDAIISEYTDWKDPDNVHSNRDALDAIVGDYYFTCGVNDFANYYAKEGNNVFLYYYKHVNPLHHWPLWTGALHGDEIEFIFGHPLNFAKNYTVGQINFSKQMMKYWANFAKTGNPNRFSKEYSEREWPPFTPAEQVYINLDVNDYTISQGGLNPKRCAFWKNS